jgi:hypothetical protein
VVELDLLLHLFLLLEELVELVELEVIEHQALVLLHYEEQV